MARALVLLIPTGRATGSTVLTVREEGVGGGHERGLRLGAHVVLGVDLGAAVEQQPGGRGVTFAGGAVEGSDGQWLVPSACLSPPDQASLSKEP
mgnify:CR=1 FL=1